MHTSARLLLAAGIVCVLVQNGLGQTVIDSPPTAYPFQSAAENFTGDVVLNVRDGAQIFRPITAHSGGTINLLGGELTQGVSVGNQGLLNVSDGHIGGLTGELSLESGSRTVLRGGRLTRPIRKFGAAELVIEGFDFELGGNPVPGLNVPGDQTSVTVPLDAILAGVYASGAAFIFYGEPAGGDVFFGDVTLRQVTRPTAPSIVYLPADPQPPGILPGQTVVLNSGGALPAGTNGPRGSTVRVNGGTLGAFEAYHSRVEVAAGASGVINAYEGASVRLTGGSTSFVNARRGSDLLIDGGQLMRAAALAESKVELRGGTVTTVQLFRGSEMLMTGGEITNALMLGEFDSTFRLLGGVIRPEVFIPQGAHLMIEGGSIRTSNDLALITATARSELTVVGRSFKLGGADVPGLVHPGDSIVLTQRDGKTLEAVLRDGSPLKLFVGNGIPLPLQPRLDPLATLRLTLVPEPTVVSGTLIAVAIMLRAIYIVRRR
jgi:hypothetical protein